MAYSSGETSEQVIHMQVLSSTSPAHPAVEWQKTFPNAGDTANCIIQTGDGGYAVVGQGNSKGGNPTAFLFKLDSSGNMQWNKSYSTGNILTIIQTSDGGYALNGVSKLIKTDSEGNTQWNKTFNDAYSTAMAQTKDGAYALAGYTTVDASDFWLAKIDSAGTLLWNKTYGGTGNDLAYSLAQTNDDGFAVAGKTNSFSASGDYDFALVKTDAAGNQQWLKTFGGAVGDSEAKSVIQSSDGGYVLAGDTAAYGSGGYDAWLVKTDSSGNLTWTRTYGGTGELPNFYGDLTDSTAGSNGNADDYANSLIQTSDGGLAFVGSSQYAPGAGTGYTLVWLVKTDSTGNTLWNTTFGSPFDGWAGNSLIETNDGAFAIAGYEQQPGFPWLGNYYIVKTKPVLPSSASPSPSSSPSTSPTPAPILAFPLTTISADGAVAPSTAPIQRKGNVYELTGNLNGPITVNRDNIVIDGAGYSLQGNGSAGALFIRKSQTGINLTDRTNITIRNLQIYSYNYAIYLDKTTAANISGNNITQNEYGIFETASPFAAISGNNITQNNYGVFATALSTNNNISNNTIEASSSYGITLNHSDGNIIFDNNISTSGIDIESGSNNLITGNLLYSSYHGVYLNEATDSIIAANNFTACSFGAASPGGASGNLFYMNNFNNTHTNEFKGNETNSWDNGTVGNYWSDYLSRYPNATEIDNSGIGDTPYAVVYGYIPDSLGPLFDPNTPNPNNVDHYPLLAPIPSVSTAALAQTLVSAHSWSPTQTQSPPTNLILIASSASAAAIVLASVVVLKRRKKHT